MSLVFQLSRDYGPGVCGLGAGCAPMAMRAFEPAFELCREIPALLIEFCLQVFFQRFPPTHPSWCVGIRRAKALTI